MLRCFELGGFELACSVELGVLSKGSGLRHLESWPQGPGFNTSYKDRCFRSNQGL